MIFNAKIFTFNFDKAYVQLRKKFHSNENIITCQRDRCNTAWQVFKRPFFSRAEKVMNTERPVAGLKLTNLFAKITAYICLRVINTDLSKLQSKCNSLSCSCYLPKGRLTRHVHRIVADLMIV